MSGDSTSMHGGSGSGGATTVAPFVAKTYRMVDDPATEGVIGWGRGNNSFVVADPFVFSQTLLPAHFKHSNFSSFVRQLNTYGFRKVDPDRWEFAHVSFLRGQTHLLRRIVRRSSAGKRRDDGAIGGEAEADEESTMVAMEVVRLRQEQRAIEERVTAMWCRVQETERRPKQMLAFLVKVVGDPHVLRRLVAGTRSSARDGVVVGEPERAGREVKRARLLLDDSVSSAATPAARRDGLFYAGASEDAFVPEAGAVDFTGFYTGGDGFGDAPVDTVGLGGAGDASAYPACAFPVDSGY